MLLARVMRVGVTVQARQHVHMLPRQFTKGSRWNAAAAINLPTMVAGNDTAVAPKQQQLWAWQVPQQRHLVDVRQFHCTALAALASKASRAAAQEAQEAASVAETDGAGTADVSPKKGRRGGRAKVKRQSVSTTESTREEARALFTSVWRKLCDARGGETAMVFPKEIIWLGGAPGAGKGTISSFIMQERGLTAPPIEVSALLQSEFAQRLKDEGRLVGDREVIEGVLAALLEPENRLGVIVDGFPRTTVQAECLRLLHDELMSLRHRHLHDPRLQAVLRRPVFHITVLYVEEAESIRRQLNRGRQLDKANKLAQEFGVGSVQEMRATDVSEELAAHRYKVFKEQVYAALQSIKDRFHFHFIPADGTMDEVKQLIRQEFAYQSTMELGDDTYQMIRGLKTSTEVVQHGRQRLVQRLNSYAREHAELFQEVIDMLEADFMHILERQALAGRAVIRSSLRMLDNPVAVNMALDVLSERGFTVALDVARQRVPVSVAPYVPGSSEPQRITCRTERLYVFRIEFPKPHIREHIRE